MTSLRRTLFMQLLTVTLLIIALYTLLLYSWFFSGVHFANHEFMHRDAQRYKQWYQQDPNMKLPVDDSFAVYLGFDSLPQSIARLFNKQALVDDQVAVGEVNKNRFGKPEYVVLLMATELNNSSKKLMVVNFVRVSQTNSPTEGLFQVVILCAATLLILMAGFATRLYTKIIKPMEALSQLAQKAVHHKVITDTKLLQAPNEFGALARTFEYSVNQINQRNRREKHFLQNLSHELRTPIAIIAGSLELIDKRRGHVSDNISKALQRLTAANQQMENLTEALLQLASNQPHLPRESFQFAPVLLQVWQDLAYLNSHNIRLQFDHLEQTPLIAARDMVTLVLANLLRNAIEHNDADTVQCSFSQNLFTVCNQTASLSHKQISELTERGSSGQEGFGLGLDIVSQICQKQQWDLNIQYHRLKLCVQVNFTMLT